ncbi:hypothetical protein HY642_03210 [Candidatus Woesearchaeota archaeon]|nr:hypothetical protein [Candidatus Woesearchaeota archaeon]
MAFKHIINAAKQLYNSFKFDHRFVFIWLYDALFYFLAGLATYGYLMLFKSAVLALEPAADAFGTISQISNLADPALQGLSEVVLSGRNTFLVSIAVYTIFYVVMFAVLYALFKGLIWLVVLRKQPSWKYFSKLFMLDVVWLALWMFAFLLVFVTVKDDYAFPAQALWFLAFIHFTGILHYRYALHGSGKSFGEAFSIGTGKLGRFILPFVVFIVVLALLSKILWPILPHPESKPLDTLMLLVVIFAPIFAWFRPYIASVAGIEDSKR